MFTVYLEDGKTVQVELDDLKDFLDKNHSRVVVQKKAMGKRRTDELLPTKASVQ